MLRIHYLYHSGFWIELNSHSIIFDYYPHPAGGLLHPRDLPADKPLFFFISHRHSDHYTKDVLDWCLQYPHMHAVISSDIPYNVTHERITVMEPYETVTFPDLSIHTFRSTDEGVAFLLKTEGLTLYHAGDLNWWHWFGEDEQWNRDMAKQYQKEVALLKDIPIDYAFLPLDPRLEAAYDWGVRYFLTHVTVKHWLPMHFGDHPEVLDGFTPPKGSHMIPLTRRGEIWDDK